MTKSLEDDEAPVLYKSVYDLMFYIEEVDNAQREFTLDSLRRAAESYIRITIFEGEKSENVHYRQLAGNGV